MRARLTDPVGPFWTRVLGPALATLGMLAGLVGPFSDGTKGAVFFSSLAALLLSSLVLGRRPSRDVTLELGPGHVDVVGAGVLNQRLTAQSISGASAARTRRGVEIALLRSWRDERPVLLEVKDDDDAKAVRDALGIGYHGFGVLVWPTHLVTNSIVSAVARLLAALGCMLAIGAIYLPSLRDLLGFISFLLGPSCALAMAATFFARKSSAARLALGAEGIGIRSSSGVTEFVPYASVASAHQDERGLVIRTHDGARTIRVPRSDVFFARGAATREEMSHIAAQIVSAALRAHGAGAPPPVVTGRVADLARGESAPRDWLARIDATAQMLANGAGYRGAGFEEAELWTTLEDHDAAPDVRAAAARVLVRLDPGVADRVEGVLAAVRAPDARKRIRIALEPDIELASRELEELEHREDRRSARQVSRSA